MRFDRPDQLPLVVLVKGGRCPAVRFQVPDVNRAPGAHQHPVVERTRGAGLEMESVFGEGFTGAVQITDFDSIEELENWCVDRAPTAESGRRQAKMFFKDIAEIVRVQIPCLFRDQIGFVLAVAQQVGRSGGGAFTADRASR